jgi:hypothetical protein
MNHNEGHPLYTSVNLTEITAIWTLKHLQHYASNSDRALKNCSSMLLGIARRSAEVSSMAPSKSDVSSSDRYRIQPRHQHNQVHNLLIALLRAQQCTTYFCNTPLDITKPLGACFQATAGACMHSVYSRTPAWVRKLLAHPTLDWMPEWKVERIDNASIVCTLSTRRVAEHADTVQERQRWSRKEQ